MQENSSRPQAISFSLFALRYGKALKMLRLANLKGVGEEHSLLYIFSGTPKYS